MGEVIKQHKDINVRYEIQKSERAKHVRIKIDSHDKIKIVVPKNTKNIDCEKIISEKKNWISKKINELKNYQYQYLYLGKQLLVEEQYTLFGNKGAVVNGNKFIISVSENCDCNKKEIYNKWLKQKAERYIPARVKYLANKVEVKPNKIKVKEQKTRWGSCSSNGNIALNYKLMRFSKKVIDYVIIHELCHIKEMNHSKKFWDLVFSIMPDYQIYKKQLKHT